MGKYYVVTKGKETGVFTNWGYVENLVRGFKGASYKGFDSEAKAHEYFNASTSTNLINSDNFIIVYTDGSYKNGNGGFGVKFLNPPSEFYGKTPPIGDKVSNNVSELYAIYIALLYYDKYFNGAPGLKIFSDSNYSINCLSQLIHDWRTDNFQRVNENRSLIMACSDLMLGKNIVFEHVKAHVGHIHNERVDRLAVLGSQQQDYTIYTI